METAHTSRIRRHRRIRSRVRGTASRPRLAVRRTLRGIIAQLIDDEHGHTLVQADWREMKKTSKNDVSGAKEVGALLAQKAKEAKIDAVVFDRGGYLYHGKIQALADGAREGGLQF